jgi:hypothetical protein
MVAASLSFPPRALTTAWACPGDSAVGLENQSVHSSKGNLAEQIASTAVKQEGRRGLGAFGEGYVPVSGLGIELNGVDMAFLQTSDFAGYPAADFTALHGDINLIIGGKRLFQQDGASRRRNEFSMGFRKKALPIQIHAGHRHGGTKLQAAGSRLESGSSA